LDSKGEGCPWGTKNVITLLKKRKKLCDKKFWKKGGKGPNTWEWGKLFCSPGARTLTMRQERVCDKEWKGKKKKKKIPLGTTPLG